MILYTNGCSWTWGGGLDSYFTNPFNLTDYKYDEQKRLSLVWPRYLGDLTGAEQVYNLATGCGSNQRIVRKTYNWLSSKTKSELSETIAVIQMTEWTRFEMYDSDPSSDIYADDQQQWLNCKIDVVVPEMLEKRYSDSMTSFSSERELINQAKNRILNTHPIDDLYRTISYLYALKGLFVTFGVKDFYVWHQSHLWHEWPDIHRTLLYENFKVLDKDDPTIYNIEPFWKYERVSEIDMHPGIEGHKQLAQHIYDAMKRLGFKE